MKFTLRHKQAGKKIENQLVLTNEDGTEKIIETCKGKARYQVSVWTMTDESIQHRIDREENNRLPLDNYGSWTTEDLANSNARTDKEIADCQSYLDDPNKCRIFAGVWSFRAGTKVDLKSFHGDRLVTALTKESIEA
jgi:hypothetical protein